MAEVRVTKEINVSAEAAWGAVKPFSGIENYSPIARSVVSGEGVGALRTCYLPDGAEIDEKLITLEDDNMVLEYAILSGPFPITDYVGRVEVKSTGADSCEVTWGSSYNVGAEAEAEMEKLFGGIYHAIIDGLESMLQVKA